MSPWSPAAKRVSCLDAPIPSAKSLRDVDAHLLQVGDFVVERDLVDFVFGQTRKRDSGQVLTLCTSKWPQTGVPNEKANEVDLRPFCQIAAVVYFASRAMAHDR